MNREKVKFPKIKSVGKRPWGEELLVALIPKKISLKILKIKKGMKGGIQYHHKKDECGYLISGTLIIRHDSGSGKLSQKTLKAGGSFHFPPGSIHQEEALTDCIIIEASTPHFNDRVRVDEKYGQSSDQGMRSTKKSEVLIK
jgi:mannose-6-phosphate isomerase